MQHVFTERGRKQRPRKRQKISTQTSQIIDFCRKMNSRGVPEPPGGQMGDQVDTKCLPRPHFCDFDADFGLPRGPRNRENFVILHTRFQAFFRTCFLRSRASVLEAFWSPFSRFSSGKSEKGEVCLDCTGVSGLHVWLPQRAMFFNIFATFFGTWF